MKGILRLCVAALLLVIATAPRYTLAQTTDDQDFQVVVPAVLSITAPPSAISQTHAETDADFALTTQQWVAKCNNVTGATIIFTLNQPFTHTTAPAFKRDARITVALDNSATDSAAVWAVAAPVAISTDYDLIVPLNSVTVAAASAAPGDATFDIDVEFLTGDYSTLANGTYATSVSATITAN